MTSITGMLSIVRTTENFWTALQLRNSASPKKIRFRNGVQVAVTYSQYIALRDWFIKLHETSVNIEKSGSSYIIRTPSVSFQTSHIETARQFLEFLDDAKGQGWSIKQDANIIKLCKGAVNAVIQEIDTNL
jgi:ABC-type Fe3+ transport system substrate-binding protein